MADSSFSNIAEYIAGLDVDIKADDSLYEERLSICKECEKLISGMCLKCGCYVEMRAAVTRNTCPGKKW